MIAARTALPACAHRHPGVPSVISVTLCTRTGGTTFERASCHVCRSMAAKEQCNRAEAARRGVESPLAQRPYGVPRFNWVPPERLLAMPDPTPTDFQQLLERFRTRTTQPA